MKKYIKIIPKVFKIQKKNFAKFSRVIYIGIILWVIGLLFALGALVYIKKSIITPTSIPTPTIKPNLARLIRIVDGDTIVVEINNQEATVRLIGIDSPEVYDPRKSVQCFGKEATEKIKELINGNYIILTSDSTQDDKDKYSRLLRYVYLEDGTFINQKMIEEGFAFEYTHIVPYKYQAEFREAQKQAKNEKLGLWADNVCPTSTPISTTKPTVKLEMEIRMD